MFIIFIKIFTKPPQKKLLPDHPVIKGINFIIPKTLVLNLSGTILHTNYIFGKSSEYILRPGLLQLLNALHKKYEIVIFTRDKTNFTYNISRKLDPRNQIFAGKFGNESFIIQGGQYIKDLTYLNRDLKKVIIVDRDASYLKKQPNNAIFLSEFQGDQNDNELFELLPFLEYLATQEVDDVQEEIKKYGSKNPQKKFLEELKLKQQQLESKFTIVSFFRGLFKTVKNQD